MRKKTIFNKQIYSFSSEQELVEFAAEQKKILVAVGGEKLLNQDPLLKDIIDSNIAYCDGYGAVMAMHRRGASEVVKIPGAYLWRSLVRHLGPGKRYYFLGGEEAVIRMVEDKIRADFGISDCRCRNGFFRPDEEAGILEEIKAFAPDVVFVALGSPRQEYLMARFQKEYPALYMGLGGSLDLYVGKAKPVPLWWNRIVKYEGLYRLLTDCGNWKRWKRQPAAFKLMLYFVLNRF